MISIIMPTFNRSATLGRAIDSVLAQTYPDWDLIIVDDGSTDDTQEVLARYADARVKVVRHPDNRGVAAAKNTGFDEIDGEWFTFLDSDDEMAPDALAVMMECATRTGANAITCNCLDTSTNAMSGSGPVEDGWLSAADALNCRGEHWGITRTELLGELRFDPRLTTVGNTVWYQINSAARRYYVHKALRVYHTDGEDRVTVAHQRRSIGKRVRYWTIIGDDRSYLRTLRSQDAKAYRWTMSRVVLARALDPVLRLLGRTDGS